MDRLSVHSTAAQSSTLAGEENVPSSNDPRCVRIAQLKHLILISFRFESAITSASQRAMQYEHQMKDLEVRNLIQRTLLLLTLS